MELKVEKGRYYFVDNGKEVAEVTYAEAGDSMIIIDHTGVIDDYRGQGLGKKLVYKAIEDARANNKKIIPLCPYAKSVFDREPELRDVLK